MPKGVPFHYRAAMAKTNLSVGKQLRIAADQRMDNPTVQRMAKIKPVSLIIFDWAGTTINPYSTAPLAAMINTFSKYGITVTMEEARGPMGISKIEHIRAISKLPRIQTQWQKKHGRSLDNLDVTEMYQQYLPLQLDCLPEHSDLIEGVASTVSTLQEQGILIGTTTGFTREMLDVILPFAKKQGYTPDATVTGDEVAHGSRPNPHMIFKNMDLLNINNVQDIVKVGDTACDIEEGLNAGCWAVGVVAKSSLCALNGLEHEAELSESKLMQKREQAASILQQAGAHYVIDSIEQMPQVIKDINLRKSLGELPTDDTQNICLQSHELKNNQTTADLCLEGDLLPSSVYQVKNA